eukprot:COSAG02_NODE_1392_length_12911_cov_5.028957_2_plen_71_part_00
MLPAISRMQLHADCTRDECQLPDVSYSGSGQDSIHRRGQNRRPISARLLSAGLVCENKQLLGAVRGARCI